MTPISTEIIALALTYVVVFFGAYKVDRTLGHFMSLGVGILSFTIEGIPKGLSWMLTITPLIAFIGEFLTKPKKREY